MGFSKRGQNDIHASLCEHCSLSPSSAKEAVPVWREVFISSFRDRFPHHCSEKTFPPGAQNVDDTYAQHSLLSVTFVDQGAILTSVRCMVYGVLVARVPERKPTPASHVCTSLLFFVISSTPMPSSTPGPTDKYDGDGQVRKSSAGALHRGAALRLFPFANSFAVLNRIGTDSAASSPDNIRPQSPTGFVLPRALNIH